MRIHRIGILTSGGDCPGLNAVLRGVTKASEKLGWQVFGFLDGFEGLLPPARYIVLDRSRTHGIMQQGGTILGTTSKGHFVAKVGAGEKTQVPAEIIEKARQTMADLEIDGLIVVGGDGSLTTALQLQEAGFSIIGVPKTIDNDLEATSMTFGFDSAVGRPLKINDQWLTVVGVLAPGGGPREIQGVSLTGTANEVYLPVTVAERKFGRAPLKSALDELIVRMSPGTLVQESSTVVASLLDRLHGGAQDYTITVPEALLEQSQKTQRLFDIVMGAIAGISLLVGGIGIMNIMLATVLERTREIGVRRAVGARQVDIRNQFVIESFAITAVGGVGSFAVQFAKAKSPMLLTGSLEIVSGMDTAPLEQVYPVMVIASLLVMKVN
jgi:ABC-type antimicrobial peptide transport system permease subunit